MLAVAEPQAFSTTTGELSPSLVLLDVCKAREIPRRIEVEVVKLLRLENLCVVNLASVDIHVMPDKLIGYQACSLGALNE